MGIREIRVDPGRLGRDAGQVYGLIRAMEQDLAAMKTNVRQMRQMWEGESKETFMAVFEKDSSQAQAVIGELKSMYGFEDQAKEQYVQCENRVMEIVNSLRV